MIPIQMKTILVLCLAVCIVCVSITRVRAQPTITVQPSPKTASLFADVTFGVSATGDKPLSYQWRFNDAVLINKTNSLLVITNVQRTNAGNYNVVVTNLSGSVTSRVATLKITPFNSMYEFGFSWTDTHNCDWQPHSQYYKGHACNGPMWPEILSTNLGLAYVEANNYADCEAEPVDILGQVLNFVRPGKPQLSVFFLGMGASWAVTNGQFQADIKNTSNSVNQLYVKGARQIVIQTHPDDLLKFPGYVSQFANNSILLNRYSAFTAELNSAFMESMQKYLQSRPDLRITFVDIFKDLDDVLADPAKYGFTKSTIDALSDPDLTDKSFSGPGANYVFWNPLHGTTKLHQLITAWTLQAINQDILEELTIAAGDGMPKIQMNHLQIGRDYILQESNDLKTWREATSFTASAGTNSWARPEASEPTSYFRLKWEPRSESL
jgi:hypothetical protein